ncbi:hypothetical protein OPIT5_06995 [Opitutaceae bacterium TAV5]|nr:hypothetical protein OPIT5_06995 [Opitutaceae bacterium TAV5]
MRHAPRLSLVFVAVALWVTSLLVPAAFAARSLPAWTPAAADAGDDLRIGQWLFQPGGETTVTAPRPDAWEIVRVPFLWTSGASRLVKPAAGQPPLADWAKKPKDWKAHDNGWFERTVSVPADWAGQRIWLAFDQLECDGLLWIDGGEPVFLEGPEARVDVTGRLRPGAESTLRVRITRWWRDVPKTMEQDPLRAQALNNAGRSNKGGIDAVRRDLPAGLSGLVRFELRPLAGEITGVFARPSVREKTLHVDVEALLPSPAAEASRVRVEILDPAGEGARSGPLPPPVVRPLSGPAPTTVSLPWPAPRLWELGDGYLYVLRVTLLDSAGRPVHEAAPVSFGFREVWVEGREIMLNGHAVHLRMAPVIFPQYPSILFWEGVGFNAFQWHPNSSSWFVDKGRRSLIVPDSDNPGMRAIRPDVIEQADRRGLAMLMPAPNVSLVRTAMSKEEGIRAYERECRLWFAHIRNHPSILMWFPSMNVGSSTRENPERIGALPAEEDRIAPWYATTDNTIRAVDPTRIVTHHCGAAGEIDYPNQYLNFMPLQERIEFPSHWAVRPDARPWGAIEHGTPWVHNFYKWHRIPQFTEWHAVYFGDRAYAAETDDYVDLVASIRQADRKHLRSADLVPLGAMTLHDEWETLFTRETNRAWRAWGVAGGWKPWNFGIGYGVPPARLDADGKLKGNDFFYTELTESEARATLDAAPPWANAIYHASRETMQPLLVYLGGPPERFTARDHAFTAGETFRKTIVAVWDGGSPQTLDATWTLTVDGQAAPVATGRETLTLAPGQILKHPLEFVAPGVAARTDATLALTVKPSVPGRGPKEITDTLALTFWPRAENAVAPLRSRWAVYDPAPGAPTAAWLKNGPGINATPVATGADLDRIRPDVLVIGREALAHTRDGSFPVTADHIARGLRVLFLEQKPEGIESMGLRIQDIVTRHAFPRIAEHPALEGLAASDLANWRGEPDLLPKTRQGMKPWPLARPPHWGNQGAVASVVIETPHRGAFTPVIDAEFDLAWSPLLEWRHGKGGILFSQLDLVNRPGGEPAAARIAQNIVRALDTPWAEAQSRRVRYLGGDDGWDWIFSLGFEAARLSGVTAIPTLEPATDILVIGPDATTVTTPENFAATLKTARAFAARGGTFLVLSQKPDALAAAATPALPLVTDPVRRARVTPEPSATVPLLRGIGPQLTRWRTFLQQDRFTATGLPANATLALEGLLLELPAPVSAAGVAGREIYCQLDWRPLDSNDKNLEKPYWNTARLYRQLLTNLGARTGDAIAARLFDTRKTAPLVNIPYWRLWNDAARVDPATRDGAFPALARRLPIESPPATEKDAGDVSLTANVEIGEGEINMPGLDLGTAKWRTYGPRASSGRVYLEWVTPAELGKIGYARSYVYSSRDREAVFAVGADYWMQFRVNGKIRLDHSREPRPARSPFAGEFRFTAPLKAGWNLLEAKVASGSGGFGFFCMVSDPGDLDFAAAISKPRNAPDKPVPADLLAEPQLDVTTDTFYVRPLDPVDDPYRFNPW